MLWSKTSAYALQALLYIAAQPEDVYVRACDMEACLRDVPFPYLAKILRGLAADGLLLSQKGKGGGFLLAPSARNGGILEIIRCLDGAGYGEGCVLGLAKCADDSACPVHHEWTPIKKRLVDFLGSQTLGEIARQIRGNRPDLAAVQKLSAAVEAQPPAGGRSS